MRRAMRKSLWVAVAVICVHVSAAAAEVGIHGVVTNDAGKPIRGAMVKATEGIKTVTRFTQSDGKYEIALAPGTYNLSVEAYAYDPKIQGAVDTTKSHEVNFQLDKGFSLRRLTSAELQTLLPDDTQTRFLRRECVSCHSFGTIQNKSGFTAEEWQNFIPNMPAGRVAIPSFIPTTAGPRMTFLTDALQKNFGPNAPHFGPNSPKTTPNEVRHVEPTDAALKATFTEYVIPTGIESYAHSILISRTGDAWFSELGRRANKIARFDVETEKFDEYPAHLAHTGVEGKDGLIWFSMVAGPDLASVDPATGKVTTYNIPERRAGTHTTAVDQQGNIWCSGAGVWKFDVQTHTFTEYKVPLPPVFPKNSILAWGQIAGETPETILEKQNGNLIFYDIKVDSKNMVWVSAFALGELIRINPVTGETKAFPVPDSPSIRGLAVDAQDNIWFASFNGNALGRLDPKTGVAKLFHPPTRYAMPYGIAVDKKNGKIWYSDPNGNQISLFDPKTEKFIEYRVPSNNASLHFIAQDKRGRIWFTELMNGKIGVLDPGSE